MMNQETADTLKLFFSAQKKLTESGIIRSRDYIGDVAKHLCHEAYDMELSKGRRSGHDGTLGNSKIRIAVNNCPIGTKVFLQEPFEFDELIVPFISKGDLIAAKRAAGRPQDLIDADILSETE